MWQVASTVGIVVIVAGVAWLADSLPALPPPAAPPVVAAAQPTNAREAWALALLAQLGNDAPTADTVAFLEAWQTEENTTAQFNPLATSQDMPGATQFNASHVKNYQSYADGIEATVRTFQYDYPGYADVLEGLRTNDPARALAGLAASPWAEEAGYGERIRALWQKPAQRATGAIRAQLVAYALSLQGIPYVRGARTATGGDCSGTMQHIYLTVASIDIGGTTFSQWPNLQPVEASDLQPGDLWFGQYADDQHVGMVAGDLDSDGTLDLINNGGLQSNMHVDYNFLANPYFYEHTMGFRRAL